MYCTSIWPFLNIGMLYNTVLKDHGYTENPMEREDVEESVKVESVKGELHQYLDIVKYYKVLSGSTV